MLLTTCQARTAFIWRTCMGSTDSTSGRGDWETKVALDVGVLISLAIVQRGWSMMSRQLDAHAHREHPYAIYLKIALSKRITTQRSVTVSNHQAKSARRNAETA